jgi:hypothetical protein
MEAIPARFQEMEAALEGAYPGVADLLKLYGEYEAVASRSNAYLDAMQPAPWCGTTDVQTA